MSCFKKLSIQGVRSFGQSDDNRQSITFYHPLTILVGQNGCGKTTVIESLRYITTGEFPPGVKGNQWVHDPKIAHESEVKAQVRLWLTDVSGCKVQVTRSMQAIQKAKNVTFKTIEGVISRTDKNDPSSVSSISSKCADINKEMTLCLGVSNAVLNNVIFCHQEDSNWPLEDSTSVKKKFDEIFAASRYIKCLANFKDTKKNLVAQVKQYDIELGYLGQNRQKALDLKRELESSQLKSRDLENRMSALRDEQEPVKKEIEEVGQVLRKISDLAAQRTILKDAVAEKVKAIQQLERSIRASGELFAGSDRELEERIANCEQVGRDRVEKREHISYSLSDLNSRIEALSREKQKKQEVLSDINTKLKICDQDFQSRDEMLASIAQKCEIKTPEIQDSERKFLSDSEVSKFSADVKVFLNDLRRKINETKSEFNDRENQAQKVIDQSLVDLNQSRQEIDRKSSEIRNLETEIQSLERQMREVNEASRTLQEIESQISTLEQELSEHEDFGDAEEMEREIETFSSRIAETEKKLECINEEISVASKYSSVNASLEMMRKDLGSKEDSIRRIKSRREDDLSTIIGEFPEISPKKKLQNFITEKSKELSLISKRLNNSKVSLESSEFRKKALVETIREKELQRSRYESELDIPSAGYESEISSLNDTIKQLQEKVGSLRGTSFVYSQYVDKLQEKCPQCPVCFRGFQAQNEVREVINRLEELKTRIPSTVRSEESKLKSKESRLQKLYDSKPVFKMYEKLVNEEIPKLKEELTQLNTSIECCRQEIEDIQLSHDMIQSDLSILNDSMPDISMLEMHLSQCEDLKRRIETEESKIIGVPETKDLDELESQKRLLVSQVSEYKRILISKTGELKQYSKVRNDLKDKILSLKSRKVEMSSMCQKADQFVSRRKECEGCLRAGRSDVQTLRSRIPPLELNLEKAREERAYICQERDDLLNTMNAEDTYFTAQLSQLLELHMKVRRFAYPRKLQEKQRAEEDVEQTAAEISRLESERERTQEELSAIRDEISRHELTARNWADNRNLRILIAERKDKEQQISLLAAQVGDMNENELRTRHSQLVEKHEDLVRKYHHTKGSFQELKVSISGYEKQLNDPDFKNAAQKHLELTIKQKTTAIATTDLDKYAKALDSAVMKYHQVKMMEVNKVIRELWHNTYQGGDIDTIEIRTEEGENSTATRKTYNYRVVMLKDNVEMDMKGRCSAGQKVLASIIIRLALAETFCLNCGIFSLDEPTTNLDRENIEALAQSLVQIINNRSQQQNFQFLIITHDQDFVELLGSAQIADKFYTVSRSEEDNLSIIKCKDFSELR